MTVLIIHEDEILSQWKSTHINTECFYCLTETTQCHFEYQGAYGYPSSYAYVSFACMPAETFKFQSTVNWPDDLDFHYINSELMHAISKAIIDVLYSHAFIPYKGCSLILTEIMWHDVHSSALAFYKATRGAMQKLIEQHQWNRLIKA